MQDDGNGHPPDNQTSDKPSRKQRLESFRAILQSTNSVEQAAESVGISTRTATRWRKVLEDEAIQQMASDASAPLEISTLQTTDGVLGALKRLIATGGKDTAVVAACKALLEFYQESASGEQFDCPSCARIYPDVPTWIEAERRLDSLVQRPMPAAAMRWIESQRAKMAADPQSSASGIDSVNSDAPNNFSESGPESGVT